ncbi:MAG: ATP-dependent DNA helicase [Victivallaceae bacterium]|nr:ATP-dependent DNA helicase [Victivallaceae bacterium]
MNQSRNDVVTALKKYFGFDTFLDNQEKVILDLLQGDDLCVIMPTGAGKSLCYQLPVLLRPGYGIIVSPLISLMKDQVDALRSRGLPAAFINSTVPLNEQQRILNDTAAGNTKLLYVAPERFGMRAFQQLIDHQPPHIMIVDEAHCISQWGHDFRPSYLRLGDAIQNCGIAQVCAFTATATLQVRKDIVTQLKRPRMRVLAAGFKRPNLAFSVLDCKTNLQKSAAIRQLLRQPAPTIIYASTRKAVEQLAVEFQCIPYHAGMTDEERDTAQNCFMNERCPVLAATNAFGMGIDRPDVRRVIHYNIPGSLEAYYQEAGRAGRDGETAECILLYSYSDRYVQEFLIDLSNPSEELIRNLYRVLRQVVREAENDVIELPHAALAAFIPEAKEAQIGSALQILEKNAWITRGFRQGNEGQLAFIGQPEQLKAEHAAQATQRSRFIYRCLEYFGGLSGPVRCSYSLLSSVAGLNIDQVKRVLRTLDGVCLKWEAPFAGRGIELVKPEEGCHPIDFGALRDKREFEIARLDEVISYTAGRTCRQAFLIAYFGEEVNDWNCDNCDHCTGGNRHGLRREATAGETEVIKTILSAVEASRGRFGSGRISLMLTGSKRAEIVDRGLDRDINFGALKHLKQNKILKFMRSLERTGHLERVGNPEYPCIGISRAGKEALCRPEKIFLDFPETETNVSAVKTSSQYEASGDDLYERLRELRKEIGAARQVPLYQILTNAALRELAEKTPVTPAEALKIKGIGPVKVKTVLPRFLAEIHRWREELN